MKDIILTPYIGENYKYGFKLTEDGKLIPGTKDNLGLKIMILDGFYPSEVEGIEDLPSDYTLYLMSQFMSYLSKTGSVEYHPWMDKYKKIGKSFSPYSPSKENQVNTWKSLSLYQYINEDSAQVINIVDKYDPDIIVHFGPVDNSGILFGNRELDTDKITLYVRGEYEEDQEGDIRTIDLLPRGNKSIAIMYNHYIHWTTDVDINKFLKKVYLYQEYILLNNYIESIKYPSRLNQNQVESIISYDSDSGIQVLKSGAIFYKGDRYFIYKLSTDGHLYLSNSKLKVKSTGLDLVSDNGVGITLFAWDGTIAKLNEIDNNIKKIRYMSQLLDLSEISHIFKIHKT